MNNKLLHLKELMPVIKQMLPTGTSVCLYDKNGELLEIIRTSIMEIPFKVGDRVDFSMPQFVQVVQCLKTGKTVHNVLPKSAFGTAMEGSIIPVIDEGQVQGVIISFYPIELEEQIKERSSSLKQHIGEVNGAVNSIGSSSNELSTAIDHIRIASCAVEKKIDEVNEITKVVSKSATRSNILALNASIEAARAGAAGKGFAVVANEMGKFSKENLAFAKKIDETIAGVSTLISEVKDAIGVSEDVADTQGQAVKKMIHSLGDLSHEADELAELAKREEIKG